MKQKTLAIPIRLVNFRDSSQVLSLFTRRFGLLEAIAKGAHRERNAFQGPFDLAGLWEVVFAERGPERGLSILTEGAVVEGFAGLRRSWEAWTGAGFLVEFLRAVGTAGDPSPELFDLAAVSLGSLAALPPEAHAPRREAWAASVLCAFQARALRLLGLSAPPSACASCGRPWSGSDRPVHYSPEAGGVLCGKCRTAPGTRGGLTVPGRAIRALEELSREAVLPGPGPSLSGPTRSDLIRSGTVESEDSPGDRAPDDATRDAARVEVVGFPLEAPLLAMLLSLLSEMRVFSLERGFAMLKYTAYLSSFDSRS